jgi:hypothetical protein
MLRNMSRSTGVVLKSQIGTGRCVCRTCSSSAVVCLCNNSGVACLKKSNSVAQRPYGEANIFSASQDIPRILWNPKVYHRVHKSP